MELGFFSDFGNRREQNTNENIIINQEDSIKSMYSIFKEKEERYIFENSGIKK